MKFDKKQYIEKELCNDYILKVANTGKAQLIIAFLLCFMHKQETKYFAEIISGLIAIIFILIYRLIITKKYISNFIMIDYSMRAIDYTAIITAFFWGTVGIFSVLSYEALTINIFITFILLLAFSLGSVNSLSHRKKTHFIYNLLVMSPLIFFAIIEYARGENKGAVWLIAYVIVALIYSVKQARDINKEVTNRFSYEYELKKSLEEVALSKKHLEEESMKTFHASRLSSLGEVAGGVAHEINNPLTIIQSLSKMILSNENEQISDTIKTKLGKIILACDRIAKIVKGMKIISSKNDDVEHFSIKVSQLIELSMTLFEERLKNMGIAFSVINDNDPEVFCNSLQVSQILINLIGNAKDATEMIENHTIEKSIQVKVTKKNSNYEQDVEIRIINSGPLIPQVVVDKIFEPFYSTKPMGKGTGLGLSISKTLAQNNHGELVYENYAGKVCFKLSLQSQKPI